VIGIFIRLRIDETPDFKRVLREGNVARLPVLDTIRITPRIS
jgi:MFS transporter, MHS family, shikimate and dehydroshikimate transport protein